MQIYVSNAFYSGVVRELNKNAKNQVTEDDIELIELGNTGVFVTLKNGSQSVIHYKWAN